MVRMNKTQIDYLDKRMTEKINDECEKRFAGITSITRDSISEKLSDHAFVNWLVSKGTKQQLAQALDKANCWGYVSLDCSIGYQWNTNDILKELRKINLPVRLAYLEDVHVELDILEFKKAEKQVAEIRKAMTAAKQRIMDEAVMSASIFDIDNCMKELAEAIKE